jgi:carbonic anhydrase
MLPADEALKQLKEGNQRFVAGESKMLDFATQVRRLELVSGQSPSAIILGCSDARVPTEIVLDQGLGDLFVIRVAGNVVCPSQIGSIEFAAKEFGTRLVVVLGHSRCGAVAATLAGLQQGGGDCTENVQSIVDRIVPTVKPLLNQSELTDPDNLLREAVRANVRASVQQLRKASPVLEDLQENEGLKIVGAKYSLKQGVVDFFEED